MGRESFPFNCQYQALPSTTKLACAKTLWHRLDPVYLGRACFTARVLQVLKLQRKAFSIPWLGQPLAVGPKNVRSCLKHEQTIQPFEGPQASMTLANMFESSRSWGSCLLHFHKQEPSLYESHGLTCSTCFNPEQCPSFCFVSLSSEATFG